MKSAIRNLQEEKANVEEQTDDEKYEMIKEPEEIVEPGVIPADHIHTPGIYVKRVIKGQFEKRIERKTLKS